MSFGAVAAILCEDCLLYILILTTTFKQTWSKGMTKEALSLSTEVASLLRTGKLDSEVSPMEGRAIEGGL